MRISIHCSLDRCENARHLLPLVQQGRLPKPSQRDVGIRPEGHGVRLPIEPDCARHMPSGGGRLAARPRPDHQHGWQLRDSKGQTLVDQSRPVVDR
jgi:hypothetical protein